MSDKWELRYGSATQLEAPAPVLEHNQHLLPTGGSALDLACGISGNGLLLAEKGLATEVWDTSAAALALQERQAQGLPLTCRQRDCEASPPQANSFDVISVCHFLYRPICPALCEALKPGGLLFYQTFRHNKLSDSGPSSPEFLLQDNELLKLFAPLQVCYYREDAACGNLEAGERNRAFFVGHKPL